MASNGDCALGPLPCKLEPGETPGPTVLPSKSEEAQGTRREGDSPTPGHLPQSPAIVTVKLEHLEHEEMEISIKQEIIEDDPNTLHAVSPPSDPMLDIKPDHLPAETPDRACVWLPDPVKQEPEWVEPSNRSPTSSELADYPTDAPSLHTGNQLLVKSETQELRFPCAKCDHTFGSESSLRRHNRVHSARVAYVCDSCQQTFPSRAYLIKHQSNSCQWDANLTCKECGQQFLLENRLQSHLRKHTQERPYRCAVCSQAFKWKCTLVRHMQLHSAVGDGKPFSCKVCGKRFTQAGLIKPHMRTHTGERPFTCPVCLKTFSHKHNMNKHQLTHANVKHTVCEVCHKQFPKESRLKYHMRVHWKDPKPFKCDHCPKSFSHRHNVTRHYKRKHPQYEYLRTDTDASFATAVWKSTVEMKPPPEYILPQ